MFDAGAGDSAQNTANNQAPHIFQGGNNLDSLIVNKNLKFIFVGGKGGVGKTTSSSAIATQLSFNRKGESLIIYSYSDITVGSICHKNSNKHDFSINTVLLVSTDPAHSLSDAFRSQFGAEPKSPNAADLPNLDVMEIDPSTTVQVIPTKAGGTWISGGHFFTFQ